MRTNKSLRQMIALLIAEHRRWTLKELEDKLGVHYKTVWRNKNIMVEKWTRAFRAVYDPKNPTVPHGITFTSWMSKAVKSLPQNNQSIIKATDTIMWLGEMGILDHNGPTRPEEMPAEIHDLMSNPFGHLESKIMSKRTNLEISSEQGLDEDFVPVKRIGTPFTSLEVKNSTQTNLTVQFGEGGQTLLLNLNLSKGTLRALDKKINLRELPAATPPLGGGGKTLSSPQEGCLKKITPATSPAATPPEELGEEEYFSPAQPQQGTTAKNFSRIGRVPISKRGPARPKNPFPDFVNPLLEKSTRGRRPQGANRTEGGKEKKPRRHSATSKAAQNEAERYYHPSYFGLDADDRTWEFVEWYVELIDKAVAKGDFEKNNFQHDAADRNRLFANKRKLEFYQRARIAADMNGADYQEYIQAQIEYHAKSGHWYDKKKKRAGKTFPRPQLLAGPEAVKRYWAQFYDNDRAYYIISLVDFSFLRRSPEDPSLRADRYPKTGEPSDAQAQYWRRVISWFSKHAEHAGVDVRQLIVEGLQCGLFELPMDFLKSPYAGIGEFHYQEWIS